MIVDREERRRQKKALDEALKSTFPASDPVSVEQPTTAGRARRSGAFSFKGALRIIDWHPMPIENESAAWRHSRRQKIA